MAPKAKERAKAGKAKAKATAGKAKAKAEPKAPPHAAPKRAAPPAAAAAPPAKKKPAVKPTLYMFKPSLFSAKELSGYLFDKEGGREVPDKVAYKDMQAAPPVARKIAEALKNPLGGVGLPAGKGMGMGLVVVIAPHPAEGDVKETCLRALAIQDAALREAATLEEKDWAGGWFCDFSQPGDDESDDDDHEKEDKEKVKAATRIMVAQLKKHFELNFSDQIVRAPVLYGGFAPDGSIVGVLHFRTWKE